jgi:flagellum-specific ATP synthase
MNALALAETTLNACRPLRVCSTVVGRLSGVRGPFLIARGFPCAIGTGAIIDRRIAAEVVGFDGDEAILIALQADASPAQGAPVVQAASSLMAAVGPGLLGRVIDATGKPIDGAGPILAVEKRDVRGQSANPLGRGAVTTRFGTGVRAIDALMTLGRGQRVILAAGSGVGKSTLIRQMIDGAEADVVVVALVGERNREIVDFVAATRATAAYAHTVTIAEAGDRSPLLRIRAAQRATAIAEYFRAQGKNVLLIVDSLTRVAHAQRELGLGTGETPTMKGYPPSALAMIPALLERCGNDLAAGGSITALYTVLADGDDNDDPVVDAARAVADGHIILSRPLAEQGVFPAIDIGRSLSRVMTDIVTPEHKAAAARVRRLWSVAEENRDLLLMGAYRAGADPVVDEALEARPDILAFLSQPVEVHKCAANAVDRLIREFGA